MNIVVSMHVLVMLKQRTWYVAKLRPTAELVMVLREGIDKEQSPGV
jgi:hypothetical protein